MQPGLGAMQVLRVPEAYLATHTSLRAEFTNASHWPKHLLLQYDWEDLEPIHAQAGLYVLFTAGEPSVLSAHSWPGVADSSASLHLTVLSQQLGQLGAS